MAKQKTLTELIEGLTWFNDVEKSKEIFRKLNAKAGSTDYIENVEVSGSTMTFTGVGNAFSGDVPLPSGGGGGTTLQVYSESGTLAGGDAEAEIGNISFSGTGFLGGGLLYSQNFMGSGQSVLTVVSNSLFIKDDSYFISNFSNQESGGADRFGINIETKDALAMLSKEGSVFESKIKLDYSLPRNVTQSFQDKSGTIALENEEYTVATLPSTPSRGDKAFITDATSPTYLGVAVGGGSVFCEVMYNGTAWVTK